MNRPRIIAAGLITTAALAAVMTAGFAVGDAVSVESSTPATITAETPRERSPIDLELPCCELADLDGTDAGLIAPPAPPVSSPVAARSARTSSSTPAPPTVVAPAPVVVEPDPAPECAPGEEHDGERCVAVQLPDERIGRQIDGPNGEVCTVVAVDPDVLECVAVAP